MGTETIDHGTLSALPAQRRPDKAEALKRAHEAAAYDEWFRQEVHDALEEVKRGEVIPHAEAVRRMEVALAKEIGPRP